MKTVFDKIYVISLISNKDRQEFMKYQMNELGLDFEFIYGIDFKNIKHTIHNEDVLYPKIEIWYTDDNEYLSRVFGCAITHYNAVLHADKFKYNKILIIEDDICFIKDKKVIEYYLNNVPEDADFITWDPRCGNDEDRNNLINHIKNHNDQKYIKFSDNIKDLCGAGMYAILNKKAIQQYIDNQHNFFVVADRIKDFFGDESNLKRYVCNTCLCTDHNNIINNFENLHIAWLNNYNEINRLNTNDFYNPQNPHLTSIRD